MNTPCLSLSDKLLFLRFCDLVELCILKKNASVYGQEYFQTNIRYFLPEMKKFTSRVHGTKRIFIHTNGKLALQKKNL